MIGLAKLGGRIFLFHVPEKKDSATSGRAVKKAVKEPLPVVLDKVARWCCTFANMNNLLWGVLDLEEVRREGPLLGAR